MNERYIDAEELAEEINSLHVTITGGRLNGKAFFREIMEEYKKSILRIIDEQPTADVVPKSEAENLIKENERWMLGYEGFRAGVKEILTKAKAEVAREIFAEIEKNFIKYYEKRVTYSDPTLLYHIREAVGFSLNEMFTEIAELKKKYTEV